MFQFKIATERCDKFSCFDEYSRMCRVHKSRRTLANALTKGTVSCCSADSAKGDSPRRGLTAVELLFAMLIMAMVAGSLAALSNAVQLANEYGNGYGTATQHARVTLERIDRTVNEAYGRSTYPGVWVTQDVDGQWTYPDTLVVWHPSGPPANPSGPPLVQELVIFCPDPAATGDFVQLTVPGNAQSVPSDAASLKALVDSLKSSSTANKVVLTNLLRMTPVSSSSSATATIRGAARFVVTLTPSGANWTSYNSGALAWNNLPWVLGIHSASAGLRQVSVQSELQLNPGDTWVAGNAAGENTTPFLGSACFSYSLP